MDITTFVEQIAGQGVLGAILAISIVFNWLFYKEIQRKDKVIEDLNKSRVDDLKQIQEKSSELYTGIRAILENILGLLGRPK